MRAYIIIDELVILFYNIMWKKKTSTIGDAQTRSARGMHTIRV